MQADNNNKSTETQPLVPEKRPDKQSIKQNPNLRANENIDEEDKTVKPENSTGAGSEITDGEDG